MSLSRQSGSRLWSSELLARTCLLKNFTVNTSPPFTQCVNASNSQWSLVIDVGVDDKCKNPQCNIITDKHLIFGTVRSTPPPWLPILTNIEPPVLRRRAATDKLITQAECHRDWPLYDDVFHPPPLHLDSHKPLWRDMQSIDVTSRWREDWQSWRSIPL